MNSPVSIYRYTLISRFALNAGSHRVEHHGALIRVGESEFGYGCIHPWPELGDLDLEETLQLFENGETTPLIRQALHCARHDAEARKVVLSLFKGLTVPESHATVRLDDESFAHVQAAGFKIVKIINRINENAGAA